MAVNLQSLVRQLRELANRFQRIASQGGDQSSALGAASATGAKLLRQMADAGRLSIDLPWPDNPGRVSENVEFDWAAMWFAAVDVLSLGAPAEFPANPHMIVWEHRGGPNDVRVGGTKKASTASRAENYAAICGVLADELESGTRKDSSAATAIELLIGDVGRQILSISRDGELSAEDKAMEITRIDVRFFGWDSPTWGAFLGVKDAYIRGTDFWKITRNNYLADLKKAKLEAEKDRQADERRRSRRH